MIETLQRPPVKSRERHHLAADAFLSAALIFLTVIGVQEGLAYLMAGGELGTWTPPVWLEAIGVLGMPLAVIGGLFVAWQLHGRRLSGRGAVKAVAGGIAGALAFAVVFGVVSAVARGIPNPFPQEGPWMLVIVVAIAVVAFLAKPVIDAVGDLAGAREHGRRHVLRLAMLGVGLVATVAALFVGGETAELGLFAILPAFPAAFAAVIVDWWEYRR